MTTRRFSLAPAAALLGLLGVLAGCEPAGLNQSLTPPSRPASLPSPQNVSAESQELAYYYAQVQNDLLTRGLLRTDGGGPDTPFDADDLVRNFETVAFYREYASASVLGTGPGTTAGTLSRWTGPVRIGVEYGATVEAEKRQRDGDRVKSFADRLARVTGHSISTTGTRANFHVFIAGLDDIPAVQERLRRLIPGIGPEQLALFQSLPKAQYCFVFAFSDGNDVNSYSRAVALVRAEHPDLVRLSCIHEEIAQGLGLPNDNPSVRPSIFNDDDEFALLTTQDEMLLKILYDPRLTPGMTADQARPIVREIAIELLGEPL
ncbi:MAG: DUF2927 domain-containing protein [Rhodobacteraceae bacterium]|nr:DUF2927 domain-containing protein [Paracoccaceae bacterium]